MANGIRASETYPRLVGDFDAEADRLRSAGDAVSLKSGGGDGTSGGMEIRLARLESDVDYIKRDIGDMKIDIRGGREDAKSLRADLSSLAVDVGRIDERVKALPSKGFIITVLGAATIFLTFADKIKVLLGI